MSDPIIITCLALVYISVAANFRNVFNDTDTPGFVSAFFSVLWPVTICLVIIVGVLYYPAMGIYYIFTGKTW
jgi:hypothetical protein